MLTINDCHILGVWEPIEWREFTRYFSGFPITSFDQQVIIYHKKEFSIKNWKDVWSGMSIFLCREVISIADEIPSFFPLCKEFGQFIIRDDIIHSVQVHIPLTGERMWKEDEYAHVVSELWKLGYIIVQTLIQTKEYPQIQWSITDPVLIREWFYKMIETKERKDKIPDILPAERREKIVGELTNWLEEQEYNTEMLDSYDIALIASDA